MLHGSCEGGARTCERNNSADSKVSEEGEGRGAPGTGAEIPLQPVVKILVTQVVPLQPMEDLSGTDRYTVVHGGWHIRASKHALKEAAAHGKTMTEQNPGRSCRLWRGAHAGTGFLIGVVAHEGPTPDQSIPEGLHPVERICAGAVCKELQPAGRNHIGEIHEGLYLWEPLQAGAEKQHEEERKAATVLWTDCSSHSPSPVPLQGRRKRSHEWSWAWEEESGGGKVFVVLFLFLTILNCYNW